MQNPTDYTALDIIVVGAGMVGLTAALAFKRDGFKVLVVDTRDDSFLTLPQQLSDLNQRQDDINSYDNRVSALTKASENIFENLSIWHEISQMRANAYLKMRVWDGQGTGEVDFSSVQMHTKNLGHIVENKVVLSALLSRATEQQLPIICNAKVTDLSEPVLGNGEAYRLLSCEIKDPTQRGQPPVTNTAPKTQIVRQFKATLIVGADGALSKIRQLSAIPLWQWDYGHHAIVATVETLESHQQTAWQRFTEDGPLAFLPLASDKLCSIVWSTSPAHAKALMAMSDRQFKQALSIGFEHRIGEVVGVANRAAYPLSHRHAKYYVKSGLALIGDAIHTIHPLAGQGVNLGLLDAAVLADTLANAKQRRQSIGSEALLKQYQRLRYSDNLKMSATMQAFKYLFDPQNAPLTIARNLGMNLFNKSRPLKQHIMLQAMGLSGKMPELAHKRIR